MRAYKRKKNLRRLIKKAFYDATSLRTIFVAQKTKSSSFMYIEKHKKIALKKQRKSLPGQFAVKKPLFQFTIKKFQQQHFNLNSSNPNQKLIKSEFELGFSECIIRDIKHLILIRILILMNILEQWKIAFEVGKLILKSSIS